MAAILDFANTPALSDSRLGIHRKSKEYNLFYICAKLCSFGRIYPKISQAAPTNTNHSLLFNLNPRNTSAGITLVSVLDADPTSHRERDNSSIANIFQYQIHTIKCNVTLHLKSQPILVIQERTGPDRKPQENKQFFFVFNRTNYCIWPHFDYNRTCHTVRVWTYINDQSQWPR